MANTRAEELDARLRVAEEKAWWRDMTGVVGKTDQQLVVIGPRSDATADDLRSLGQALARWRAELTQARHIWGLTDLGKGDTRERPRFISWFRVGWRSSTNVTSRWPWSMSPREQISKRPQGTCPSG